MVLGEVLAKCKRYVSITFEGSPSEGVIETTFKKDGGYLKDLDLRGTGLSISEIVFPGYENVENKLYLDDMKLSQLLRNSGRYVELSFEGEPETQVRENFDYAFSCGGYVCGDIDMSIFTGMKSINGINKDNDTCDLVNFDISEVVSAEYAFSNSGLRNFNILDIPKLKYAKGIIDNCTKLKEIKVDNCTNHDICDSVEKAVPGSNIEVFSARNVDYIDILDFGKSTNLNEFYYSGLGLYQLNNLHSLENLLAFVLIAPSLTGLEDLVIGKKDGPLHVLELEVPSLKTLRVLSGELQIYEGLLKNVEEVYFETPKIQKLDFSGTQKAPSRLRKLTVVESDNLTFLDLSYTEIVTLDLTKYPNIPYVEFNNMRDKVMVNGWKAQYCKKLATVTLLDSQAHALQNDLNYDNDSLIGCIALKTVNVITDTRKEEKSGHETHYSTADFLSDITYKGKLLEDWIGEGGGGGGGMVTKKVTQAEYDALPESKLTDNVYYEIIDDMQNASPDSFYSTEEKVIGEWIDGSRIYRKVYVGLALGRDGNIDAWAETGITNNSIKLIVNATSIRTDSRAIYKRFEYSMNGDKLMYLNFAKADLGGYYDILVLEYTKK